MVGRVDKAQESRHFSQPAARKRGGQGRRFLLGKDAWDGLYVTCIEL